MLRLGSAIDPDREWSISRDRSGKIRPGNRLGHCVDGNPIASTLDEPPGPYLFTARPTISNWPDEHPLRANQTYRYKLVVRATCVTHHFLRPLRLIHARLRAHAREASQQDQHESVGCDPDFPSWHKGPPFGFQAHALPAVALAQRVRQEPTASYHSNPVRAPAEFATCDGGWSLGDYPEPPAPAQACCESFCPSFRILGLAPRPRSGRPTSA